MTLEQLRKDAAFYCETCHHKVESEPGGVFCDHSGDSTFIAYSCKQCPLGHWDHTGPVVLPDRKKIQPIPRDQWGPTLNQWIDQKIGTDTGIGDTLNRLGGIAKAILVMLTPNVRCSQRQAHANALYPYDTPENS